MYVDCWWLYYYNDKTIIYIFYTFIKVYNETLHSNYTHFIIYLFIKLLYLYIILFSFSVPQIICNNFWVLNNFKHMIPKELYSYNHLNPNIPIFIQIKSMITSINNKKNIKSTKNDILYVKSILFSSSISTDVKLKNICSCASFKPSKLNN
jgi:hypothetical protein